MKKVIISSFAVFAILGILVLVLGCRFYDYYIFTQQIEFSPFQEQGFDYFGKLVGEPNDDNFPYYLIKFMADIEKQDQISDLLGLISEKDKSFQKDAVEKLLQTADPLISNDLYRFNEIVPIIKNKMKETKNSIPVSFNNSEMYPNSPRFRTIKNTSK